MLLPFLLALALTALANGELLELDLRQTRRAMNLSGSTGALGSILKQTILDDLQPEGVQVFEQSRSAVEAIGNYFKSMYVTESQEEDDDRLIHQRLRDYYDVQVFSRAYIGSSKQPFDLIFDTGSTWTWVYSQECLNCPDSAAKFDTSLSSTFQNLHDRLGLAYGTGRIFGKRAQDTVCLAASLCTSEFRFMTADIQYGLNSMAASGIVGLSPNRYEKRADLLMDELYLDERVFSISMATGEGTSFITFGGYALSKYAKANSTINWHSTVSFSSHWELSLKKFSYNVQEHGKIHHQSWALDTSVIIDSGTSFVLMPKADMVAFLSQLANDLRITFKLALTPTARCSENQAKLFPDLKFLIDGHEYFVPRESWVSYSQGKCHIKLMTHSSIKLWILGLNFFENYYTIFDQESFRVGFAPSIHAKPISHIASMVEDQIRQHNSRGWGATRWMTLAIVAIALIRYVRSKTQKIETKKRAARGKLMEAKCQML